jgi:predicted molibdopterin-dependent oxidoreductase YjgC
VEDSTVTREDHDLVRPVSRRGTLGAEARLANQVLPGLDCMALHFAEAKASWLTIDAVDPRTCTPEYNACAVRPEKA